MSSLIRNLPRAAFYAAPPRPSWDSDLECDWLVFLPQGTALHDSGYRFMDAVAGEGNTLLCRVSGCSDVFHLELPSAIWTKDRTPTRPTSWGIDCLKRSGLMRVFSFGGRIRIGAALSSLYVHPILPAKVDA